MQPPEGKPNFIPSRKVEVDGGQDGTLFPISTGVLLSFQVQACPLWEPWLLKTTDNRLGSILYLTHTTRVPTI
jgi:hypothetical protein